MTPLEDVVQRSISWSEMWRKSPTGLYGTSIYDNYLLKIICEDGDSRKASRASSAAKPAILHPVLLNCNLDNVQV